MEGLEIKEKEFSTAIDNKDFRIDSQFYTKEPLKNPILEYDKIGNHIVKAQYGISISMNEEGSGYPIYRMNEIHNMMCDTDVSKSADISKNELETFVLNDRDVLFNRTNSFEWVGRTGLYKKTDTRDFVFASYLVRFIPKQETLLPEYLTTFLNSKYGVWDIKRRARQSINQTNVNPEEVKEIEFPLLSLSFQKILKSCFDNAYSKNILSQSKYQEAENLLLETLGLKDFEPSKESVNIKSFNESFGTSGRLDAEHYQIKYDSIEESFNKFKRVKLGDIVNYPISSGITPKAGGSDYTDIPEEGFPFVRAVDISNGQVMDSNFIYIKPHIHNGVLKRTQLKQNDVLFSIAGTVGRCGLFQHQFEANINQAVSILRFEEDYVKRLYLICFFNSEIGKLFVSKYSRQGLQTNLNLNEVAALNIPIIDFSVQVVISDLIDESFSLKKQSEQLLDLAKKAVEKAIEENEEKATIYINEKLTELKIPIYHA